MAGRSFGPSHDLTGDLGFAYNPGSQIASTTRSNDSYAWTGHGSGTTSTTSACSLGTQGAGANDYGPDRIAKTLYDSAGRSYQTRTAVGTADEANEVTATYTANGQVESVTDAEGNKTTYEYDGHDRLAKTYYPLPSPKGAGTSNGADYEQLTYESLAGGTRTSPLAVAFRNRAGETIGFGHDALGRPTSKDLPGSEPDATYAYDLLGRLVSATQNGITVGFTWDALGRQLTQSLPIPSIANPVFTSEWDLAGRRTRYSWPVDASGATAYYVDYDYLVTGEVAAVREKGATSGAGVLATFGYDDLGRRTSLTRGNGAVTTYAYDAVSRLGSMSHDFSGTAHDLTLTFAYNPASQIASTTRSNDLYAWNGHGSGTTSSTADGLNRLAGHGGATPTYDAKGNLTYDGTYNYTYSSENLLTSGANSGALEYDPLMRFFRSGSTWFAHDGGQLVGDYHNGNIVGRYVPGPGIDEPLVQVDKFGARTWFHADERGSIVAGSDAAGANARIILYDEYGRRGSTGSYRFGFTGQVHLINDMYDYKSRHYNARLGRFLQTDTIGYGGGMNMYAYVDGDPVNFADPGGTSPYASNRPEPIDLADENYLARGPSPADLGGGHSRDGMGMWDIVFVVSGRVDVLSYERALADVPDATSRLNQISQGTGISTGCLLSKACTDSAVLTSGGNTFFSAPYTDSEGFTNTFSFTIERGLGAKINEAVVADLSELKVITRFTAVVQCNKCLAPLFGGSFDIRFLNPAGRQIGATETIVGRIGQVQQRKIGVPFGAYTVRFVPTILTPPSTHVIVRGLRRRGW